MKLILGSGGTKMAGWVTVDKFPPADILTDLNNPWPWVESSINEIVMIDVIEHLKNKVFIFNEAFRVLKPMGLLQLSVPSTDGRGAFQDPSHISFWNSNSWRYFNVSALEYQRFHRTLGITSKFNLIRQEEKLGNDHVIHSTAVFMSMK